MYRCNAVRGRDQMPGEGETKKSAMGRAMAAFRKKFGDAEGVKIEWQGDAAPRPARPAPAPRALEKPEPKATRPNPAPKATKAQTRPNPEPTPAPAGHRRGPLITDPWLMKLPESPEDYLRRKANKYAVIGYTTAGKPHYVEIVVGKLAARAAAGRMEKPVAFYTISKLAEAGALQ